eukprot:6624827-Alexandrium_andersonii.AAC.1
MLRSCPRVAQLKLRTPEAMLHASGGKPRQKDSPVESGDAGKPKLQVLIEALAKRLRHSSGGTGGPQRR